MKKYILAALAMLMLTGTAYAQTDKDYVEGDTCHTMMYKWFGEEAQLMGADADIDKVISDYMNLRLESLTDEGVFEADYLSEAVLENEISRRSAIVDMEDGMAIDITDAATHFSYQIADDGTIEVREWIFYDYDDLDIEGVGLNVSGFGTEHYITLEKGEDGYIIVSDEYDETPTTGMNTLSDERKAEAAELSEEIIEDETATLSYTHYPSYNVTAAVAYSDKYALNYNTAYYNFASLGGDCANFTSQCIYAGGMPQVVGSQYGTNGWYYKKSNDRSATWTGANQLCNWMANNRGNRIVKASSAQIFKGSPVFFDWENDGKWNHATFCVGRNSEGSPIINGHTSDQYHAKVDMSQQYCVVQLTSSDMGNIMDEGTDMIKGLYGPGYNEIVTYENGGVEKAWHDYSYYDEFYHFMRLSNGAYTIRSTRFGTYLTADSDGVVRAKAYTGASNQQWYFYDSYYTDKLYIKSAAYENGYMYAPSGNTWNIPLKIGAFVEAYENSFELGGSPLPDHFSFEADTAYGNGQTKLTWIAKNKDNVRLLWAGGNGYTLEVYKDNTLYGTYDLGVAATEVNEIVLDLEPGDYSAIAKMKFYGRNVSTQVITFTVEHTLYPVKITASAANAETTSGYLIPNMFDTHYEVTGIKEGEEKRIIEALYDEDGRLLRAYTNMVDSYFNSAMSSVIVNDYVKTFKYMVFESLDDIKPLAVPVTISIQ